MSIDSLATWQAQFALLPKVSDTSWKQNLADFIANRVDNKLNLSSYDPANGVVFIFNKTVFLSALAGVSAGLGNGVSAIALGVKNAVIAAGSLSITPPISIGTPSPTNTFSVIVTSIITSSSSILAENKINELSSASPVANAVNSLFPVKLREAFLLLTADITGIDSVTPTPGVKTDLGRSVT